MKTTRGRHQERTSTPPPTSAHITPVSPSLDPSDNADRPVRANLGPPNTPQTAGTRPAGSISLAATGLRPEPRGSQGDIPSKAPASLPPCTCTIPDCPACHPPSPRSREPAASPPLERTTALRPRTGAPGPPDLQRASSKPARVRPPLAEPGPGWPDAAGIPGGSRASSATPARELRSRALAIASVVIVLLGSYVIGSERCRASVRSLSCPPSAYSGYAGARAGPWGLRPSSSGPPAERRGTARRALRASMPYACGSLPAWGAGARLPSPPGAPGAVFAPASVRGTRAPGVPRLGGPAAPLPALWTAPASWFRGPRLAFVTCAGLAAGRERAPSGRKDRQSDNLCYVP